MSPSPTCSGNASILPLNVSPQTNIGAILCYLLSGGEGEFPIGPITYHPILP